jgi:hypothetical protein
LEKEDTVQPHKVVSYHHHICAFLFAFLRRYPSPHRQARHPITSSPKELPEKIGMIAI